MHLKKSERNSLTIGKELIASLAVKLIYDLFAYSKENQLILEHLIRIYCVSLDVRRLPAGRHP